MGLGEKLTFISKECKIALTRLLGTVSPSEVQKMTWKKKLEKSKPPFYHQASENDEVFMQLITTTGSSRVTNYQKGRYLSWMTLHQSEVYTFCIFQESLFFCNSIFIFIGFSFYFLFQQQSCFSGRLYY